MPKRSWFFASRGQQQGPYSEVQLQGFIGRGIVTATTLVWSEGMTDWQEAGGIPGLFSGRSGPPAVPYSQESLTSPGGGSLSIDFGIWEFVWRSLILLIGAMFIIPFPWVFVPYCDWMVSCTRVPGRPNLSFTGRPMAILWWYLGAIALLICLALIGSKFTNVISLLIQTGLYWLGIRWFLENIASDGRPLGLSFSGSFWGYLGWNVLTLLSMITIIGCAWVYVAQIRWMCRYIEGTRRAIMFNATGLDMLWRGVLLVFGCVFLIPIPWVVPWFTKWYVSQFELVEETA
jgi:hypothetical protein